MLQTLSIFFVIGSMSFEHMFVNTILIAKDFIEVFTLKSMEFFSVYS